MSSDRVPDFAQHAKDVEDEILASGDPKEQLLDQIREALEELRETLATYHHFVDGPRYTMVVEDVDEYEAKYKTLAADTIDAFEHQDYVDLLTQARTTLFVMATAHHRYATESAAEGAKPAPAATRAKGCGLTVAAFVASVGGFAALLR